MNIYQQVGVYHSYKIFEYEKKNAIINMYKTLKTLIIFLENDHK